MELRQLEYFVAVAEEASFTRAAQRVHISQSGVSAQIRQLERALGATLFDRTARTATLTVAGQAALSHARAALASAHAVRRAVDDVTGLVRGRLTIGMISGCTMAPLFDALAAFHRVHPGVDLVLVEDDSDVLVDRVRAGTVDLALVGAAGGPPAGLATHLVAREPIVAAVPPGHPLASRSGTSLAELCRHPVVCLPVGTGIRAVFDQACAAAGLHPDVALQASAPAAVADLARRGFGAAVLSASMTSLYADGLRALSLDVDLPATLALVWSGAHDPALRALLPHLRGAFPAVEGAGF